jgi:hypothetical protein
LLLLLLLLVDVVVAVVQESHRTPPWTRPNRRCRRTSKDARSHPTREEEDIMGSILVLVFDVVLQKGMGAVPIEFLLGSPFLRHGDKSKTNVETSGFDQSNRQLVEKCWGVMRFNAHFLGKYKLESGV